MTTLRLIFAIWWALAVGFSQPAIAQSFPTKPVFIVVPYAAGGGTDVVARALAAALQKHWNRSVVVENFPGADGIIGTQRALRSPPDGHTLILQLNTALVWKPAETNGRDLVAEMTLVSLIQTAPLSFAVSSRFPGNTMQDFIEQCRKKPCSLGVATRYAQLIGARLMDVAGLKNVVSVTYKGGGPMTNDLLGGQVDMAIPSVASASRFVQAGQMKMLAVGSAQRFPLAPNVPTLVESGLPVFGDSWYGLMVSKDVPPATLAAIVEGVKAASKDEALLRTIETGGGQAVFSSPEEFTAFARKERDYLAPLLSKYQLKD